MEAGHQPLRRLNAMVRSLQSLLRPLLRSPRQPLRPLLFQLLHLWLNLHLLPPLWHRQHCKRFPRRLQRLKMSA